LSPLLWMFCIFSLSSSFYIEGCLETLALFIFTTSV
jgi:hypothetical protein